VLFAIYAASTTLLARIHNTGSDLTLEVGGTSRAYAVGALPTTAFAHFGVSVKINSSAGWITIYKDGVAILTYSGNTGNADMVLTRFGTPDQSITYTYYDDLYIDDTTGEAAAATVPDRRFAYVLPNADGNYSQCAGSDGNSVNNSLLVDEQPHNSETDYVEATALDQKDTYNMATITLPTGNSIAAVIPYAYARKTDAAAATLITNTIRTGGVDLNGADQALASAYGIPLWTRFVKQADGATDWNQAALDALEVGFVGRGAF
jgi:hypothetical protein